MAQIKIDVTTGDLAVESGGFTSVTGVEEIRQHLWLRLQIILGEIAYNTELGVPYPGEVFAAGTPPERIAQIFRETILGTPGVTGFDDGGAPRLELDSPTRTLSVAFRVTTDYGVIDFSTPLTPVPLPEAV